MIFNWVFVFITVYLHMSRKQWKGGFKRAFEEVRGSNVDESISGPIIQNSSEAIGAISSSSSSSDPQHLATADIEGNASGKKFRGTIANMFLSNRLSSWESHDLVASATEAGAKGSEDLAKCGTSGANPKNMHRDMLRALLRNVTWPDMYWADIPVLDPDTGLEHMISFPFMLPHEIIRHLLEQHGLQKMLEFVAPCGSSLRAIMDEQCAKLNLDADHTLALGLHGDGTPFAAKMRDSLEQFSFNFPASCSSTRFVFTGVPKRFVAAKTMEAILAIFVWSMHMLCNGIMPTCRHDGTNWTTRDNTRHPNFLCRAKLAGLSIGIKAILCQIRGDWAFYKAVFNFPSWSSDQICWLCQATRKIGSAFDMRSNKWQNARYRPGQFVAILLAAGLLSCIFQSPGLEIKHFLVDWLHCADLGICQSILGNLFNEIVELLPGSNRKDRVCNLWQRIKAWYKIHDPPSKLEGLTPEMIRQPGKGPKFRSKAGECRYLSPSAAELAQEFDDSSVHRNTVNVLCQNLQTIAVCISCEPYDSNAASAACHRLRKLFAALETLSLAKGDDLSWKVKPKLHMFEELICYIGPEFGSPRLFWTYTDEHWGAWLARTATRRGGPKFAASCALNLLQKYRAIVSVDL